MCRPNQGRYKRVDSRDRQHQETSGGLLSVQHDSEHRWLMRILFLLFALVLANPALALEELVRIETRQDIKVPVFYIKNEGAQATVLLFSGGQGGMGKVIDGRPTSANFLVRSRNHFAANGLNVAVFGLPSDRKTGYVEYSDRLAPEHLQDIKGVVDYLRADSGLPVWLVGTSRGTVSATAAAIDLDKGALGGIVLTASIVSYKKAGAVPTQDINKIQVPVLLVHHEKDGCAVCAPHEVPGILRGLKNTPVKKLLMISEGENPTGDPCEALHYHGFIGAEKSTVDQISTWIKNPTP